MIRILPVLSRLGQLASSLRRDGTTDSARTAEKKENTGGLLHQCPGCEEVYLNEQPHRCSACDRLTEPTGEGHRSVSD